MNLFIVKRYLTALRLRSSMLLLALIPVALYLVYAAMTPDRCEVYQDVAVSEDAPVAVSTSPVDTIVFSDIQQQPLLLFLDKFAVKELYRQLYPTVAAEQSNQRFLSLRQRVASCMRLTAPTSEHTRITYYGPDPAEGRTFTAFYSSRLLRKADEGAKRIQLNQARGFAADSPAQTAYRTPAEQAAQQEPAARLHGTVVVRQSRALMRSDRIVPALVLLGVFVLLILVLIGIQEWADPSFKSERQVARYLLLPTLGSLPDLNRISKTFGASTAS